LRVLENRVLGRIYGSEGRKGGRKEGRNGTTDKIA